MIPECTPTLTIDDVRSAGSVRDAIILWAETHDLVASGEEGYKSALNTGSLAYIDPDDGRAIGQVAPDDDTPEDEILHDIAGVAYLVSEWTEKSVVELEVPNINDAVDYPEIARAMSISAQRYHADRSDANAWIELIEQLDEIAPIADILKSHGDMYTGGGNGSEMAGGWIDEGITDPNVVDMWCEARVWDPAVAAALIAAGLSPDDALSAADALVEGMDIDQRADAYTDGDPIYAACNGDISVDRLISASRQCK
jgi:hypothetical protein